MRLASLALVLLFGCAKQPGTSKDPGSVASGSGSGSGSAAAAPATTGTCETDAECTLVNGAPPSCCSRCSPGAMTIAQADQARAGCEKVAAASPNYFDRCPHLDCACEHSTAHCKDHACVVESAPCTPPGTPAQGSGAGSNAAADDVDAECTKDADCTLVSGVPPGCCSACTPKALSLAAADKATAVCNKISKADPVRISHCPHLSCTCQRNHARCKAQRCVVESTGC